HRACRTTSAVAIADALDPNASGDHSDCPPSLQKKGRFADGFLYSYGSAANSLTLPKRHHLRGSLNHPVLPTRHPHPSGRLKARTTRRAGFVSVHWHTGRFHCDAPEAAIRTLASPIIPCPARHRDGSDTNSTRPATNAHGARGSRGPRRSSLSAAFRRGG